MQFILRVYKILNILSVDIVAGAVISALFFARILEVQITLPGLFALGLTVWIIYTADHLRDAKAIPRQASTARHRFHQRHFNPLIFCLCVAIVVDAITIIYIRRQALYWGLTLTPVIALYLAGQQHLRFIKEFFIAILYTFGVLLLSVSITPIDLTLYHYLMIIQFAMLAWINLILFSWFDYHDDKSDALRSFVTAMGRESTEIFLYFLFAAGAFITAGLCAIDASRPVVVLTAMNVVLFLVFVFRQQLSRHDSYRIIGDSVFLFPLFYLL